jgi:hypothetical protein
MSHDESYEENTLKKYYGPALTFQTNDLGY